MKVLRTLVRMVRNSDATTYGIAKIERSLESLDRSVKSINQKLEVLIRIMNKLREIQKGQLIMQRGAAEAIKQSTVTLPESVQAAKPPAAPKTHLRPISAVAEKGD
jgi:hypothetical protein